MPRRLHLEGDDLEALKAHARQRYPNARFVTAERVRTGGIAGFLAREHYELVLELPDPGRPWESGGLETLLASADAAEASLRAEDGHPAGSGRPAGAGGPGGPGGPGRSGGPAGPAAPVSTESHRFAELLDALTATTGEVHTDADRPPGPLPFTGAGDLVMVAGPDDAAARVAGAMQRWAGAPRSALVRAGSSGPEEAGPTESRNRMMRARAAGVEDGHATFVAFGLGRYGRETDVWGATARAVAPDQVWLVVDAGRKPDDTARWVHRVREVMVVDALAVEGREATATPETVHDLGVPVGWYDDLPADRPAN